MPSLPQVERSRHDVESSTVGALDGRIDHVDRRRRPRGLFQEPTSGIQGDPALRAGR